MKGYADMDNEKFEYLFVHEDTVKKVINDMPEEEKLYDLAELFKIFGDSTRIKILYALFEAELCVCDIAQLLKVSQTAVSHQLRVLKTNKGSFGSTNCSLYSICFFMLYLAFGS